ncbi:helix-turn-helix domain-containing protein [Candidatus Enterococcus mangumiae]|uniref:DNA-binding protein n=1 Tax=Candidatus Enterococcus mangumiae TaxID=2230878 RepID=A0ABZ2T0I8_9ENTE|nr:helix-turn-helix domain-containing protein [Enterococcus sp. DIV1094]MBO0489944.1 helix-turn-helix domain-containing protein [Enterococcus sp. DIV1094]
MQTFLTKISQKKIILLEYLLEKDTWCSMQELKEILTVTEKSILHYIEELSLLFLEYGENITLENRNNKQFWIHKKKDFPIYNIYLYFYKDSYNYQLIDFMYHYPDESLESFAKSQYTNVSTVFRYAKLLVPYFERHRFKFQPFKLELNAEEIAVRSFFYYFYWNSTRHSEKSWPFKTSLSIIKNYINAFEEIYQVSLSSLQRRMLSYWLTINLERSKIRAIKINQFYRKVVDNDYNFSYLNQWVDEMNLDLSLDERYFLYQIIYSFGIIDGNKKYENSHATIHKKVNTPSFRAVLNLAVALEQQFQFKLDIEDPELIFNFVAFHERSSLFFGNTDLFFNRSYIKEIQEENLRASIVMEDCHKILKNTSDSEVTALLENWEQLFLSYYFILDYYDLFLCNVDPIKILIQDDLHHTHRLWLMNKIQTYYGHAYFFAFYDYQTEVSEVDLVISNYYLNTEKTPLLLMKNIPTNRNWRQLDELLSKIAYKKANFLKEN